MTEQPVAIVTGAGSGVGRAVCQLLAEDGYCLTLVGRREAKLRETIGTLSPDWSERCLVIATDLSRPDAATEVASRVDESFGRLDVLINNAGAAELSPLSEITWNALEQSFATNLFGAMMLVCAFWAMFERQKIGCVVNVSSMSTVDPFPGLGVYGAAKAGLENLTKSIINEGREIGLRAFSIAPGAIETEMLRSMFSAEDLPPERVLSPEQVAAVIADCVRGEREDDIGRTIVIHSR